MAKDAPGHATKLRTARPTQQPIELRRVRSARAHQATTTRTVKLLALRRARVAPAASIRTQQASRVARLAQAATTARRPPQLSIPARQGNSLVLCL